MQESIEIPVTEENEVVKFIDSTPKTQSGAIDLSQAARIAEGELMCFIVFQTLLL